MAVIGATQLDPVNVLGSYVQGAQIGQQMRAQRQQEADARRALQEEQALNSLVQAGALDTAEGRNALLRAPGGLKLLESYGKTQEQLGKGTEAQTKGLASRMQFFRQNIPTNPQMAATWLSNAYADPVVGAELSKMGSLEEALAAIPTDPAQYLEWLNGVAMFADEYAKRSVPSAEAMLPYTQPLAPEVLAQKKDIAGAGAARTTITMPSEKEFSGAIGKAAAGRLDKYRDSADSALKTIETSRQLAPLLDDPKFISGTFADARLALARAAGIDVASTEAYFAAIGQQVAERITAFGAGTGLSDADREFAKSIAGGNPVTTAQGIRDIIRINNESARNVINKYNTERNRLGEKSPEVLDYYPEISVSRQIKREGMYNGQRVVEYDDGSIEYAD